MKEKWKRLTRISEWSKKHSFLTVCALCAFVCLLVCIGFFVHYLCFVGPTQTTDNNDNGYTAVSFSDPAFEAAVRNVLSRPEGDIYQEEVSTMNSLTITNQSDLSNIEDIRYFTGLKNLQISGCCVYDAAPVANLKFLETLNLSSNKIKDIEPLCGMESLMTLDVSGNNISRIPDEINRLYLQELNVSNNRISDIDCLTGNSHLTTFYIRKNKLTELPDISGMQMLVIADFGDNAIETIAPMAGVPNLSFLSVDSNCLSDLDFLRNQLSLRQVNISFNNIQDISVLSTCLNFESLTLYGEKKFDLTPLHGLERFNTIYVDKCFDRSNIDFMVDHFRAGDGETVRYVVAKRNMIEN